ncbi:MAG: nucleotidyl transferase AbiEii/AbiGii toxin family protein [Candidatus Coatesbacteria bacterium]
MISRSDIEERVREWGLREDIIEKDHALGWLLRGIGSTPPLSEKWVFKGGTCLKKCYLETYRFSEDLDFTIRDDGPLAPDALSDLFSPMLARITEESGIDFEARPPVFERRKHGRSVEGRVYYRGARQAPEVARIKIDLTADEAVARPPETRPVFHPYPDNPSPAFSVLCYSFLELFAEKIRAMGERSRPRDLYDIVNLYRRPDLGVDPAALRETLVLKCNAKGVPVPTLRILEASPFRAELESEWANMLAHQLPVLPPFEPFWRDLGGLFRWLFGEAPRPAGPSAGSPDANVDVGWSPPPSITVWRARIPLEQIRFAAANHLCVELGYNGSTRLVEPYSLRRNRAGNLLFYAMKVAPRALRSYSVGMIQSVKVTTRPFEPVAPVEFSATGPLTAPLTHRRVTGSRRYTGSSGTVYIVECSSCGRHFTRKTGDTAMKPHRDQTGDPCYGRSGHVVETR